MAEMRTPGAGVFRWPSWQILSTSMLITAMLSAYSVTSATPQCPAAFWNFGDSLSETGGLFNLRPFCSGCTNIGSTPYGEAFFGKPAKRSSNGRVVPDYFALAFRKPLLQPYVQAGAFDFRYGANFASGGASASNDSISSPIFLATQIAEFVRLKTTATSEKTQLSCILLWPFLPLDDSYTRGLYTIELGGNDILQLVRNKTASEIVGVVIPEAMTNIAKGVETLYNNGARQFLFFNVPKLGCDAATISVLGSTLPTDSSGCVSAVNQLAQTYNAALNTTIAAARLRYPAGSFTTFNYYGAHDEILLNPAKYGFNPNLTSTACCGAPGFGNVNFNLSVLCGDAGSNKCANPEEYVVWDGIHYTEAFYRVISKFVLNGQFTDTGFNYTSNCNLTFKDFGNVTFNSVYGATCKATFVT